jgi:hypothetical protein
MAGKIFDFVLIFLVVIVMTGGLIPKLKDEEQFEWKDILKLMIFVGIIVYILGLLS